MILRPLLFESSAWDCARRPQARPDPTPTPKSPKSLSSWVPLLSRCASFPKFLQPFVDLCFRLYKRGQSVLRLHSGGLAPTADEVWQIGNDRLARDAEPIAKVVPERDGEFGGVRIKSEEFGVAVTSIGAASAAARSRWYGTAGRPSVTKPVRSPLLRPAGSARLYLEMPDQGAHALLCGAMQLPSRSQPNAPYGPPLSAGLGVSGFWFGRLLISRGRSAPRQPATLPNGIASLQGRLRACAANRPHRRDEGVNHFSAGHFLTHHSQPDCGGEGTPRLSPLLWSAMGLPGMVSGSAVHLSQFRRSSMATAVP